MESNERKRPAQNKPIPGGSYRPAPYAAPVKEAASFLFFFLGFFYRIVWQYFNWAVRCAAHVTWQVSVYHKWDIRIEMSFLYYMLIIQNTPPPPSYNNSHIDGDSPKLSWSFIYQEKSVEKTFCMLKYVWICYLRHHVFIKMHYMQAKGEAVLVCCVTEDDGRDRWCKNNIWWKV